MDARRKIPLFFGVGIRISATPCRVLGFIETERLPVWRIGRDNLIKTKDLARVKDRKPARPKSGKAKG